MTFAALNHVAAALFVALTAATGSLPRARAALAEILEDDAIDPDARDIIQALSEHQDFEPARIPPWYLNIHAHA
jgi:hypothetical protein